MYRGRRFEAPRKVFACHGGLVEIIQGKKGKGEGSSGDPGFGVKGGGVRG